MARPRGEEDSNQPPQRREGGIEEQQRFAEMLSEIEILGPDKDDRNKISVHNTYGMQVAMSEPSLELVYELKVPLHVLKRQPYAVAAARGKTISLDFEMGEMNREKMKAPFGREGGGPGGGRPEGGGKPGGEMRGGPPGGFGMVLGAALLSLMERRHFENIRRLRTSGGLQQHLQEIIRPDSTQQEIVNEILSKRIARMDKLLKDHFGQMDGQIDSLQLELRPFLTPEQMHRLTQDISLGRRGGPPPR